MKERIRFKFFRVGSVRKRKYSNQNPAPIGSWKRSNYNYNSPYYFDHDYICDYIVTVYIAKNSEEELMINGWCLMEGIDSFLKDYKRTSFGINRVELAVKLSEEKREEFKSFLKAHNIKGIY